MSSSIRRIFLFLLLRLIVTNSRNVEETLETADQLLEASLRRFPRRSEEVSPIWMEYEFNSGVGNREELVVTNISLHEYTNLPKSATNWQYFEINGTTYLACAEKSSLSLHKVNLENIEVVKSIDLSVEGIVLNFKVISLSSLDVVAVLCVQSYNGTSLRWYRLVDEDSFEFFWLWPVQKQIQDMEFVQQGDENKLLLLDDDEIRFGQQFSPVDVYGFKIDFSTHDFHFWLCQRTLVSKAFDIQVCSIYESIFLALRGVNDIFLYEYKDNIAGSVFQELQTIKSHDLKNFVCFDSGYLQFLAVSGPEAGLFHFVEGEFEYNTESESNFDISEISWIKDVRLNTYRDESLLLLQLKNSTVIALAWQGLSFRRIQLPNNVLDQFNLSTITPVPKFGFLVGNQFVKFHTELRELKHPIQSTTEKLLILQRLLNDSLNHQERILDETEARIGRSYLKNPVITGFWNLSSVNTIDANITSNVIYHSVSMGSKNLTKDDLKFDVDTYTEQLKGLERKLNEIDSNLMNAVTANSSGLSFNSDVEIFGNININGTLNLEDLIVQSINGINVMGDSEFHHQNATMEDKKSFSSIEADNLTIYSLNGIPVEQIRFSSSIQNYHDVNFSKINTVQVNGHLFFNTINGVNWESLMKNIVWTNEPAVIPGNTVIEGTLTADIFDLDTVNDLLYPEDYVLNDSFFFANVTGVKSFDKLMLPHLKEVHTLNGIDFEDFVILNRDNVLKEEIRFENVSIEGKLQIDGEITGLERKKNKLLNETSEILNDVTFMNLNVLGDVRFDTLFMNKRPLKFEDLLLKTEENVEITGSKTFLGDVRMESNVTITSGMVNGHFLDEFVTLDTEQDLPNLLKILPNVTFGNVTLGAIKKMESFFDSNSSNNCLEKIIVFKSPIMVDELFFNKLNNELSYEDFQKKLNETFQNIYFNNLTVDNLYADEIIPSFVNGIDFLNFTKNLASTNIIKEYEVDRLETDHLNATFINGLSFNEINELNNRLTTILTEIFSGNVSLNSLGVTGIIKANSVNGKILEDMYNEDQTGRIIFEEGVSIQKLTILGSMNGLNFSELVSDAVLKTDTNIVLDGHKTFNSVNCDRFETVLLNGRPVEKLFDPSKEQVLAGPVVIDGTITVLKEFNSTGRINNISFHDLMDRFKSLENNTFEFHGDVRFNDNVTIENLYTNGSIQGTNFDSFLETVVFKNEENVTISGTKVFEGSVTFNNGFIIYDKLNDIDLRRFQEKAVFIDKPFWVKSKMIFRNGIKVENDVAVTTKFDTKSIMGIDFDELRFNILYLNRPTYITEPITFTNISFQSDIEIVKFNDIDMNLLIPLNSEQTIEMLRCRTVNAENIQILGKINEHDLKQVQENTFMVNGSQNITGHFKFHGQVHMRRNFNAHLLNGIDPTKIVSLDSKSKLKGNFVFQNPIHLNQSLRVLGYLNGIDPARWEAMAVTKDNPLQQSVSGTWTVHGDVRFENGAFGSDILNGTNITEISNTLAKKRLEMDAVLMEKNENLMSVCEDLSHLKHYAEKQIYQFNVFDYLQIIEFDSNIVSVNYFELKDQDYLMLSYNTCHMHTYMFTGTKFELVVNVPNFGVVEHWTTFRDNDTLYFLTSGAKLCGRNPANLWKLQNDEFTHVLDLGHSMDNKKINQDMFLMWINSNGRMRSSKGLNESFEEAFSSFTDKDNMKIVLEGNQTLLFKESEIYENNVDRVANNSLQKSMKRPEVLNFKVGALQKERILYYDEGLSEDYVFICNNGSPGKKILQALKVHRPMSFTVLNIEGSIETLLIFIENRKILRIYEYKGVQGFVYRDAIKVEVDKLLSFKIRKYPNLAKRYCLALIRGNRLTILEAQMYGEKLDMEDLSCSKV